MCHCPLRPEDLSQQLYIGDCSLSNRINAITQPGYAYSVELLYKEYFAKLLGESWELLHNRVLNPPVLILG